MSNAHSEQLRIVVSGLAATYPYGGVFWDYLQYVIGFLDLGHDVLYLEDTGRWCYDPTNHTFVEGGENNAAFLKTQLENIDSRLVDRWFFRDGTGKTFGQDWSNVAEFCKSADLFMNISASCWMRDEYFAAQRVAFLDSDPMYTQADIPNYLSDAPSDRTIEHIQWLQEHDVFFTFAENIGQSDCLVPYQVLDWIPSRQPIVLRCFENNRVPPDQRRRMLTTVASWEPTEKGPEIDGVKYVGKSREFERFMSLPKSSGLPLELAISGGYPAETLRDRGWHLREALEISGDPVTYRDYLATSWGEWSVAKNAYVASRSGWFSCRTACYLALGVPAIVQDTGFAIPSGDGVLAFHDVPSALVAIDQLATNPDRHCQAASEIAREYFDSSKVLTRLLEQASASNTKAVNPCQ